jgi:hypothetical protein
MFATTIRREASMDEARYAKLIAKRDSEGLSNDEANELGRLEAEKEGVPYEGHGPDAVEADAEATIEGRHKPGSPEPIENEGVEYEEDVRTAEVEIRSSD